MISTFGMMWALDFTLNSVTMLALVLMVGIVIDDAIVVLENIFRFVEEKKMRPVRGRPRRRPPRSAWRCWRPRSRWSSSSCRSRSCRRISGRFLYQFGITAAVAVLVSLLVSFTLTPMMSARLLRARTRRPRRRRTTRRARAAASTRCIDRGYARLLRFAMRHRRAVVG